MKNLSQIKELLNFLSQNNYWKQVLNNGTDFYNFSDIHKELLAGPNNYSRYFRIYINHHHSSILIHHIYCPDQKYSPSGVVEPSETGIWLGYFKLPDLKNRNFQKEIKNLINQIRNTSPNSRISGNINDAFLYLLLLELVLFLINNGIWQNYSQITLKTCKRCW